MNTNKNNEKPSNEWSLQKRIIIAIVLILLFGIIMWIESVILFLGGI